MFNGKNEIRKDFDNMVVTTEMEDGRLLKLKGTFSHTHNFAYLSHHGEGIMPSSLLWHSRFGHIHYDNLRLLRKNGVSGLPTIPKKLKQCNACILGNHIKQPFHDVVCNLGNKLCKEFLKHPMFRVDTPPIIKDYECPLETLDVSKTPYNLFLELQTIL
jgi:hypothetical protein